MRKLSYAKELSILIDEITTNELSDSINHEATSKKIIDLAYRHGHDKKEVNRTIDSIFKVLEARVNAQLRKDRTQ